MESCFKEDNTLLLWSAVVVVVSGEDKVEESSDAMRGLSMEDNVRNGSPFWIIFDAFVDACVPAMIVV